MKTEYDDILDSDLPPLPKWPRNKRGKISTDSWYGYLNVNNLHEIVLQFYPNLTDIRDARQLGRILNQWADAAETRLR